VQIIKLQAENFKRLSAVDITPDKNMVVLSGANEQGKSSVLDAIMAALCGGRGMKDTPEPIRNGENRADVTLDLGGIKVRRIWEPGKSRVEVTNADGMKYSSPQGILDALTGTLTFDPLEFARMQPREQRATLLRLVELPFDVDENDRQRAGLVQAETAARQDVKRAEDAVASCPPVPDDTPDEETSASDILAELQRMRDVVSENNAKRAELSDARVRYADYEGAVKATESAVDDLEKRLAELRATLDTQKKELAKRREVGQKLSAEVDALVDPDTSELDARLASLDETNRNVRQKRAHAEHKQQLNDALAAAEQAKKAVATHDKARAEALSNAKFPVSGLGFDDNGVTLNGLPFSQASESQRIMTSAAMGMAMNSRLRVMFVRDGSALDSKRMDALTKMAEDNDFQIWVEVVDESGQVGIVIEDGQVRNDAK